MEKYSRSVIKLGDGHAVVLPTSWVRTLNILKGDRVFMRVTKEGELVIRAPVEWEKEGKYKKLIGIKTADEIDKSVVRLGSGYVVFLPNSWVRYFELSEDDKILMGVNDYMELVIKVPDVKKRFNVELEKDRQREKEQKNAIGKSEGLNIELDKPMFIRRTYAKDQI